ncbi:MAG: hypothetical protein OSJ55_10985, partial [Bacteroidales bacterium]|nr:hypothetical protein [Bacteroidales bacterium]
LHQKHGDNVKILFDCSYRDDTLLQYQSYINTGVMDKTKELGDQFQNDLREMVIGLQASIPNVGVYIWNLNEDPTTHDPPPVKRTAKKYKDFSQYGRYTVLWQPEIGVACCADNPNFRFLLGCKVKPVFLHRRQNTEVSLYPAGIVVVDVTLNHLNEFLFASKPSAVIAFTFQDAPKSFHWAVVNTMAHT